MNAKPIVKWAGGKRQLMNELLQLMPTDYNNYFEPFVGGGALLFTLLPDNATINDVNDDLLAIYYCLADEILFEKMIADLDIHEKNHNETYFYQIRNLDRNEDYQNCPIWKRASRTLYLNKSCFNGLFRVNSNGYFNVPSGKKTKVQTYDRDNIKILHKYFTSKNVTILNGDFTKAIEEARTGDFVYFDPPYDPIENKDSFTAYTKYNFNKDDQIRLAKTFEELSMRGVKVMLSNHNTHFINELYKKYYIHIVNAKRMINSDASKRGLIEEVIITNYEIS